MTAEIKIIQGDVTQIKADAVVNAANKFLAPGGGVAGAIHYAAGPQLTAKCRELGGCETGEAKITPGYELPASYVIHTVGPVYGQEGGEEEELLASCYRESLALAEEYGLKSIAFPGISTGAFGYPKEKAFRVAVDTIKTFLEEKNSSLKEVILAGFTSEDVKLYKNVLGVAEND
ncbi:MAG TPA: O-acetyl-ADP-ribose deacetylase [Patescibacteria group bacterium]|nr:O-acetyl-ADP-ribose deacetylase [Patescibacteria group bacterium]